MKHETSILYIPTRAAATKIKFLLIFTKSFKFKTKTKWPRDLFKFLRESKEER